MFAYQKKQRLNLNFHNNKPNNSDFSVWKDVFGTHIQVGDTVCGDYPELIKYQDFLYEITCDDIDYEFGNNFLKTYSSAFGACSSFRNGNFYGRKYDWYYDNAVSFVVRTPKKEGRFASVGVAQVGKNLTKQIVESGNYTEFFKAIPTMMLDGINENGVVCNTNVVPFDKGKLTQTNPTKPDLSVLATIRLILDKATTALDGVRMLSNYNIFGIDKYGEDLHIMIGDKNSTYVVEFINNKINVISDQNDEYASFPNNKRIMTNFHLTDFDGNLITGFKVKGGIKPQDTTLEPHAMGTERYQIISEQIDNIDSEEKAKALLNQINYTNAYNENMDPYWNSEMVGYTKTFGDLTIYDNEEKYEGIKAIMQEMFATRTREKGDTWISVHTALYNIEERKLILKVQEEDTEYTFTL